LYLKKPHRWCNDNCARGRSWVRVRLGQAWFWQKTS
jgi:hypothetical protein